MRIIELPKPFSWLQWPVKVLGCEKTTLHITAKFFGDAAIDRNAIIGRVPLQQELWIREDFQWRPVVWRHDVTKPIFVLELIRFPESMQNLHDRFDLIKDQFPKWRPHITVDETYWTLVEREDLTPQSEELLIGEIELCLGTVNQTAREGKGEKNANHN